MGQGYFNFVLFKFHEKEMWSKNVAICMFANYL